MSRTFHDLGYHGPSHIVEQGHLHEIGEGVIFGHTELWCAFWPLQEFAMQHDGLQRRTQA